MAKSSPVKKGGMGCCGCGCLILVLLVLLFLGLIGGGSYLAYQSAIKVSSSTPVAIPKFDGGDDVYSAALQKMKGFNHDVAQHVPATIRLNSDELNTLIARNPNFQKYHILIFVNLQDDQARIRSSLPTDYLSNNVIKGRYLNSDILLRLGFNADTKMISLNLKRAQFANMTLPNENLAAIESGIDPACNSILQKDADYKAFIDQVSTMQIKDSELVIQTK